MSSRRLLLLSLALLALVALVFGPARSFDYTDFDDPAWIAKNPQVAAGLSTAGVQYAFRSEILGHWTPLTVLSHMAICQGFGLNPGAHHLANVVLHALAAIALFLVLHRLTGATWRSAIVAALFAVHPLRAESVAWVTERKDVLSGLFFFLTIGAYGWWVERRGAARYLLAFALAACGLMAKSMLVTLPCVLLLLDYWPLHRGDWKRRVLEKLPFFILSLAASVVQMRMAAEMIAPADRVAWSVRLGNAIAAYGVYLRQTFWPAGLAAFYPHRGMPALGIMLVSLALLSVISLFIWRCRKSQRYLWVGWLWFLGMLVPVIGLIQSGGVAHADRYTYLPQVGLFIMIVWGLAEVSIAWPHRRWLCGTASWAAVTLCACLASRQAATWRSAETLWTHALSVTEGNFFAHNQLGCVAIAQKDFGKAVEHLRQAAQIAPEFWRPHANLCTALLALKDFQGADEAAGTAMQLAPGLASAGCARSYLLAGRLNNDPRLFARAAECFEIALKEKASEPDLPYELALTYQRMGNLEAAARNYQTVLTAQPDRQEALAGLGESLAGLNRLAEAVPLLERALAKGAKDALVLFDLANCKMAAGEFERAEDLYRQLLGINPDFPEAQANLAWMLATCSADSLRNGAESLKWAKMADQAYGGSNPAVLRVLAAAQAETEAYDEADATLQRAITLAQQRGQVALARALQNQRAIYQAGLPFRINPSNAKPAP